MSAFTHGAGRIFAALLCALAVAGCKREDGFRTVDPALKVVRVDSDANKSYLALAFDGMGRMFVGGKEDLFVYEPKAGGLYQQRRLLWRFPKDAWVFNIAVRGHDLYVLTVSALYVIRDGVVKRKGLEPRRLLWGYPTIYCHSAMHGMMFGPDGDLYVAFGDPVFYLTHVTDMPDHWGRWTFHHGPEDARLPYTGTGGVLRLSPDGRELHVWSGGMHNVCGLAFDEQWNLFGADNDHEQNYQFIPARLLYMPEHANFSWPQGWMTEKEPWRSDLLQTMTPDLGRCVPSGICYYNEGFLPEGVRDRLFVPRWESRTVPYFSRWGSGDAFKARESPFLAGPKEGLARPITVAEGRGGRLFVILCYMAHNEDSPAYQSHLLMVTKKDDPPDAPFSAYDETRQSLEDLFRDLDSASWERQFRAHVELTRRGNEAYQIAAEKIKTLNPQSRSALHLIWLAAAERSLITTERIVELTRDPTAGVRLTALRALARFGEGPVVSNAVTHALADEAPQIRHAALIAAADCDVALPVHDLAQMAADTLNDIIASGVSGTMRTNWEDGSYIRQMAVTLLAQRAKANELSALCNDLDARMRLTGILAIGTRLTVLVPEGPMAKEVPIGSMIEDGNKRFFVADRPEDMRYIAAGSFFSTRDIWMAATMTPDEEALRGLLEAGMRDTNRNIARQSLYYLRLIRHKRADDLLAANWGMVEQPPIDSGPIARARPAGAARLPAEFRKFNWTIEAGKGDAGIGKQLFEMRGCNRCHSVRPGDGGAGGPSLAGAGSRLSFAYMAESVMAPNAVVLPEYRWTAFKLKDGDEVDGLVTSESAETIEVLMPSAARRTVKKEDILSRQLQNHSPMPEGLIQTPGELRDLLAYLGSLK